MRKCLNVKMCNKNEMLKCAAITEYNKYNQKMGNNCSRRSTIKVCAKCSVCSELVSKECIAKDDFLVCVRCNVLMHRGCNKDLTQCPNCMSVGTIGYRKCNYDFIDIM